MYKNLLQHPKISIIIGIIGPLIPILIMGGIVLRSVYVLQSQRTAPTASTSDPQVKAVKDVFTQLMQGKSTNNTSSN